MILHVVAMNHFASGCRFSTWIIVACCYSILTESCHLNINMHHPCLSVGWNFDMLKFKHCHQSQVYHPLSPPCGFIQSQMSLCHVASFNAFFFKFAGRWSVKTQLWEDDFPFPMVGIGNRSLEGTSPSLRWCFSPYLKPRQIWISFFFGENWRDLTPSEKCMRRTHFTMVDIVFFKRKSQSSERVMPTLRIILPLPL